MDIYIYFASYTATKEGMPGWIFGRAEIPMNKEVNCLTDIRDMEQAIKDNFDVGICLIQFYTLLRVEEVATFEDHDARQD